MNRRLLIKLTMDFIMTALMLVLFAYQLTGNQLHEFIGYVMLILLITHNILNRRWYKNLLKGKYNPRQIIGTVVNLLLIVVMSLIIVSGIMLSRDTFFLRHMDGGFEARRLHMMSAHWLLVLVSIHIGLHWNMIINALCKLVGTISKSHIRTAVLRLMSLGIAVYGVKSSFAMSIGSKIFMRYAFGYWDFENAAMGFFMAYLSIMGLYIVVTHYTFVLLQKFLTKKRRTL